MTHEDITRLICLPLRWSHSASQCGTHLGIIVKVFRILPWCHHHLKLPRRTTYWNVILSPQSSIWRDAWSLSQRMLCEADTHTKSLPLESSYVTRGPDLFLVEGDDSLTPWKTWLPSSFLVKEAVSFLSEEVKLVQLISSHVSFFCHNCSRSHPGALRRLAYSIAPLGTLDPTCLMTVAIAPLVLGS